MLKVMTWNLQFLMNETLNAFTMSPGIVEIPTRGFDLIGDMTDIN